MVIFQKGIPEGIVGILTGKIADEFKTPAFVFTQKENGAPVKGSGRSYGDFDMSVVLDAVRDVVIAAGGHRGAAGITVAAKDYPQMRELMQNCRDCLEYKASTDTLYDLEVYPDEVPTLFPELKQFAPFGEGVPRPIIRLKDAKLYNERGKGYMLMGKDQEHLKLFFQGFSAVGFGLARRYEEAGVPEWMEILGTVAENVFNRTSSIQVQIKDFSAISLSRTEFLV